MTEVALIHALKTGLSSAYDILYHRYWRMLYKQAYSRVMDEEAAKDIVQNVFISIWQKRESLTVRTSLEQFLQGAVKFQVLNHFRSERVKQRVIDLALAKTALVATEDQDHASREMMEVALDNALQDMPENMKQSFLLRCDNRSIKDIAKMLGLAEQTVSNNLSEVVKRLRQKLAHGQQGGLLIGLLVLIAK